MFLKSCSSVGYGRTRRDVKVEERQKKRTSKINEVAKKHSRRVSEKIVPRRDEVAININTKNLDNIIEPPRKKPTMSEPMQ